MIIKKTYEYSTYKSVSLTINFKDEEEYQAIMEDLLNTASAVVAETSSEFDSFCNDLHTQLEAPCS